MKKKHLLERIEELEERVAILEDYIDTAIEVHEDHEYQREMTPIVKEIERISG